jgi:CYTH domain-containing protein
MGKEIERKFLVKGDFIKDSVKEIRIVQAYLSTDPMRTVRVRICDNKAFLTIKSSSNSDLFDRNEWETGLDLQDAAGILDICLPGRIEKTRYIIPWGNHKFEVDVFHGKNEGLIIAEIELENRDELFERPGWLGEEVTGNPGYYNSNLI